MPSLSELGCLAQTVRHLKVRQIRGQLRHRVKRWVERNGEGNGRIRTPYPGCAWPKEVCFLAPDAQENNAEAILSGTLRFLNQKEAVGFPPRWHRADLNKLWMYNLHYFEWLWALEYGEAKTAILDWIENHRLTRGAVGWESYPTSLRLINWCAVFFGGFREQIEADRTFVERVWKSIYRQVEWLGRHLETHLLGNHYLENGIALAFTGSCFQGRRPLKWLERGCQILAEQIPEQILPDGMHFELSPMYHCRVMYALAMLKATGDDRLKAIVAEPLSRMYKTLERLCHPDGRIALLNDSAFGIYNEPVKLKAFCAGGPEVTLPPSSAREGCFSLPSAGYYGWQDRRGNYILCDSGRIGSDYIPGHAHADIFSFELSLNGHRVIVDSGVSDYEASDIRRYCRSTAAHNTLEVDGADQCEMWGAFRVARRGYPRDVKWEPRESGFVLSGWHDGYRRLPSRSVHRRIFRWDAEAGLHVFDHVTASRSVTVVSRLHLHPACRIEDIKPNTIDVSYPGGACTLIGKKFGEIRVEEGVYCPEFGVREENQVIAFERTCNDCELSYHIVGVAG